MLPTRTRRSPAKASPAASLPEAVPVASLTAALAHLADTAPSLAALVRALPCAWHAAAETVCTTPEGMLVIAPAYAARVSTTELAYAISHATLLATGRMAERRAARDPVLWNLAMSHEAAAVQQRLGVALPASALLIPALLGVPAERGYERLRSEFRPQLDAAGIGPAVTSGDAGVPVPALTPALQAYLRAIENDATVPPALRQWVRRTR